MKSRPNYQIDVDMTAKNEEQTLCPDHPTELLEWDGYIYVCVQCVLDDRVMWSDWKHRVVKHAVKLYPHQRKAVDELKNGNILNGGVGVGKSITAAAYYMEKEAPKDIYVFTTAKKRDSLDWDEEFVKFGVGRKSSVAGRLTVDSWNQIQKYKNVRGAFLILDEQRLVGSGAWVHAFLRMVKHNNWIMLSATPGDTWIDYVPVFVANGFYKNRTEFKEEHVVYASYTKYPKIEKYLNTYKLLKLRDQILVKMEYERHTQRIGKEIPVEFDEEAMNRIMKDRWNSYEDRPILTGSEFFSLMRRTAYSHPSRLEAVRRILQVHPRLILFYSFNYELDILRGLAGRKTQVLNAKIVGKHPSSESVYVGRPSKWGNPFVIGKDGTRDQVLAKYHDYIRGSGLMRDIHELRGKDLVCWCSPDGCHANILRELAWETSLVVAEWNGQKHEEVPSTERWLYLVQYAAGAEGWNCITTDATAFYSQTYSYRSWSQAHGRIDRLNTPHKILKYYYLMSKADIDRAVKETLAQKKDFNEAEFVKRFRFLNRS